MNEPRRAPVTVRWHVVLPAVAAVVMQGSIALRGEVAPKCAPLPPPCEEYANTQIVFLGTVTEALLTNNGVVYKALMRIDRAYKGVSGEKVSVVDWGFGGGPTLKVGEQYVMYASPLGIGSDLVFRCSRSRNVRDAAEDLKYLNALGTTASAGTIFGHVTIDPDGLRDRHRPAAGALVQIQGAGVPLKTTADGEGHYSFDGLNPAEYSVTASLPGFVLLDDSSDDSVTVRAGICEAADLTLRRDWPGTIEGRLTRSGGAPAPAGIGLTLIRVEGTGKDEKSGLDDTALTDERGEYSFRLVAPGRYKLEANRMGPPTPKLPYPPSYWPGASTEAAASEIEIGGDAVSRKCDFRLPSELKSVAVTGTVLLRGGRPVEGARVDVSVVKEPLPSSFTQPVSGPPDTDAAGHFSFVAMEGYEYNLSAEKTGVGRSITQTLGFPSGQGPQTVTLTLWPPPVQ
jgi:hypothetical protein